MASESEKAILDAINFDDEDINIIDLEENLEQTSEKELEEQLKAKLEDFDFLKEEWKRIDNPDNLGETVMNVVWEQLMTQLVATAGEDFIKENGGLKLNLHSEAHIQTTENFAEGKIATHNTKIDYQQRYDDWQDNFVKDTNGNVVTHTTRTGRQEATLKKDARRPFDKGRPTGSAKKHTDIDHNVPGAEIIRDSAINAHMTKDEQVAFANSDVNLNEMDSSMNRSKGDKSMSDWLDNPNSKGQKPDEIFDISPEEDKRLREKDAEAREELDRQKKEAEKRSVEAGKQSQKEEFYRIGKKALRTALMSLLAALLKEVISKLIHWLKSSQKSLKTLIDYVKTAITSFVGKLKELLVNVSESVFAAIATTIIGPVIGTIKKTVSLLRQGWQSLKKAVQCLIKPENKGKPLSELLPQVGIILISGLSGIGATFLGEFIEKGLTAILPALGVEIPLLGSPAALIGMLMGGIICGVIGAIAINLINKYVAEKQKSNNISSQIEKENEIFSIQNELLNIKIENLKNTVQTSSQNIAERHRAAGKELWDIVESVTEETSEMQSIDNDELDKLLNWKITKR